MGGAQTAPEAQGDLFAWKRPKGRAACGRDPRAGFGSCWYWWEGCPKAESRGCYALWAKGLFGARRVA